MRGQSDMLHPHSIAVKRGRISMDTTAPCYNPWFGLAERAKGLTVPKG